MELEGWEEAGKSNRLLFLKFLQRTKHEGSQHPSAKLDTLKTPGNTKQSHSPSLLKRENSRDLFVVCKKVGVGVESSHEILYP